MEPNDEQKNENYDDLSVIPRISPLNSNPKPQFRWVDYIGHHLIKSVSITIGGIEVSNMSKCFHCDQFADINYLNDQNHCWDCQNRNIPRDNLLKSHQKYLEQISALRNNQFLKNKFLQYLNWTLNQLPNTTLLKLSPYQKKSILHNKD